MVLIFYYWLWRFLSRLSHLFPLGFCYTLAEMGGNLGYILWPRGRQGAKENIARVVGAASTTPYVASLARLSFRHYSKYLVDFARMEASRYEELESRLIFNNWEAVREAHERGKGTILIGLHQGNWDMGLLALARRGYPMNVVVETFPHAGMNRLVSQVRGRHGVKLLPMENGVLPLIRVLRRNEMLGILIDQPKATAGVKVQFLDRWVTVPAGAAALALRTGASVLAGGVLRGPDNTFDADIQGPIIWRPTGDRERDIQELTQKVMAILEEMVLECPEQWFVFRPLWAEE